jgi:probable HAF family extracellular repeat protein
MNSRIVIGGAYRAMLSMLILIWAGAALSQIPRSLAEVPVSVQTKAIPPSARARQQQRAQMAAHAAAAIPVDKVAATLATANYSFVVINVANSTYVQPNAINDGGVVAGYYDDASYNSHGFIWQNGSLETFDYPGALQTSFTGINDHGVVSGVYTDASNNNHGFTYSLSDSAWTSLPAISLPDIPGNLLWAVYQGTNLGINDDGDVIGCASNGQDLSWIWHPGSRSYSYFTIPGAAEATTCAQVFNNKGHAVGEMTAAYGTPSGSLAFLQDGENHYQTFSTQSLSASGTSSFSPPFGVNDSDTVVGTAFISTGPVGFIRTRDGVFQSVNDTAYGQTYVTGINNHNVLVGDLYDPATGASPGFIAYPQ